MTRIVTGDSTLVHTFAMRRRITTISSLVDFPLLAKRVSMDFVDQMEKRRATREENRRRERAQVADRDITTAVRGEKNV